MEDRSHTQQVRHFFDRLAADYGERFTWRRPYHAWLFRERMRLATEGLDLDHASILDVGAGTGALYDFLTAHYRDLDYYACDLSAEMLRHSSIAAGRRFHGRITEITLPTDSFDFIFLLGVTTYMTRDELKDTLGFIEKHLAAEGKAVLSFSNRQSLDWRLRRLAKPLARRFSGRKGVLSQPFSLKAYAPAEVQALLPLSLHQERLNWFNPVLPPWEILMPRLWINFAGKVMRKRFFGPWRPWLCGDFLVVLSRA